jgi:hypothetical protein
MGSSKLDQYVAAIELAIKAMDSAFVRANAAETVVPLYPVSTLWSMPDAERDRAERAEIASYNVTPDHWGARLCLMSAFESLHAALRIVASRSAARNPAASAWRDAAARAREASRLAEEAMLVFTGDAEL